MSPKPKKKTDKETPPPSTTRAGGSIVGGNVTLKGSTFVGRDQIITAITTTTNLFQPVYQYIDQRPDLPEEKKKEAKELVQEVEQEVKNPEPNQRFVTRLFKDLQKMGPDILEVVCTTALNPVAGLSLVAKKIIQQAQKEAQAAPAPTG